MGPMLTLALCGTPVSSPPAGGTPVSGPPVRGTEQRPRRSPPQPGRS